MQQVGSQRPGPILFPRDLRRKILLHLLLLPTCSLSRTNQTDQAVQKPGVILAWTSRAHAWLNSLPLPSSNS